MTDETINHLNDARALISAAMTILTRNLAGDHRELPDMIATMLVKAAEELDNAVEATN